MNNFSYSYSRWRRLEVWQSVCTVLGVFAVAAERVGYFEIWWHIDGLQWSTVFWSLFIFYSFSHKMDANFKFICINRDIEHALVTLFNTVSTVGFLLSIRNNNIWLVAIVCSFSVKISNPRPKAKFFHKVGMVSEGPGRGGVATRSVHGCPLVMVVV